MEMELPDGLYEIATFLGEVEFDDSTTRDVVDFFVSSVDDLIIWKIPGSHVADKTVMQFPSNYDEFENFVANDRFGFLAQNSFCPKTYLDPQTGNVTHHGFWAVSNIVNHVVPQSNTFEVVYRVIDIHFKGPTDNPSITFTLICTHKESLGNKIKFVIEPHGTGATLTSNIILCSNTKSTLLKYALKPMAPLLKYMYFDFIMDKLKKSLAMSRYKSVRPRRLLSSQRVNPTENITSI